MATKNEVNTNFMQVPFAPPMYQSGPTTVFTPGPVAAPPMYPNIENQQQLLRPIVFPTGQNVTEGFPNQNGQNNENNRVQTAVQESRPATVFILNGKHPVGPEPIKSNCPHCNTSQISRVVSRISLKAHFVAMICCMMGLICLAPVPYCMNSFKTIHHYCNNCGQYIGSFPAN